MMGSWVIKWESLGLFALEAIDFVFVIWEGEEFLIVKKERWIIQGVLGKGKGLKRGDVMVRKEIR